jgi:hypothetical protein
MRHRRVLAATLTGLAVVLVWWGLTGPDQLESLTPAAFVRLPVEALLLAALVLVLPWRAARVVVGAAGVVLGLLTVVRVLDMGFYEALNRPFDSVIDWRYLGSAVGLVDDSVGRAAAVAAVVGAALLTVAFLVLMPWALLRLTRVVRTHRRTSARVVAALLALWLVAAASGVRTGEGGRFASAGTATYAYGQVARIPSELRDQRAFARAAAQDPLRRVPSGDLLTGLRGKDVLLVFVESYGRVAVQGSSFSPGVDRVLDDGTRRLRAHGFAARSAFLTSPTFGAISWLAHSTLQSGLWVDSQQRYDALVTSPRLTLSQAFGRAGWRTVADVPANTHDWPQGAFYHYDRVYDSRNVGYRGPRFGYPTMPDQFTLEAFQQAELAPRDRRPVMAEIDLISSHAPWSRTPDLLPQESVGDGSVYAGMPETLPSEADIWPDAGRVRAAYAHAIVYSLQSVVSFLSTYADDDLVVVLLGDHQPATIVSGAHGDPGHDVPVTVIAKDPTVLDALAPWGWDPGMRPSDDAPVWRMDAFRDELLQAYGARGHTGTARAAAR